jgi:hypothetical protein
VFCLLCFESRVLIVSGYVITVVHLKRIFTLYRHQIIVLNFIVRQWIVVTEWKGKFVCWGNNIWRRNAQWRSHVKSASYFTANTIRTTNFLSFKDDYVHRSHAGKTPVLGTILLWPSSDALNSAIFRKLVRNSQLRLSHQAGLVVHTGKLSTFVERYASCTLVGANLCVPRPL